MPEFGNKLDDVEYVARLGAYAVVLKKTGRSTKFCAVEDRNAYHLPGGGIEEWESPENALHREAIEEIGTDVSDFRLIGVASDYLYSQVEHVYFRKIGIFYVANLINEEHWNQPEDVEWLDTRNDLHRLAQEGYIWAVETALASNT